MSADGSFVAALSPTAARGELPRIARFCAVGAANTALTLMLVGYLVGMFC